MVCVTAQLATPNVIAGWPKFKLIFNRGTQRRFPLKCIENTFWAIQSTFTSLGQLASFRVYKGSSIIFPKFLNAI